MNLKEAADYLKLSLPVTFTIGTSKLAPLVYLNEEVCIKPTKKEEISPGDKVLAAIKQKYSIFTVVGAKKVDKSIIFTLENSKNDVFSDITTVFGTISYPTRDIEVLKGIKKNFIAQYWTIDSKITNVKISNSAIVVNFLHNKALEAFKIDVYKGIRVEKQISSK